MYRQIDSQKYWQMYRLIYSQLDILIDVQIDRQLEILVDVQIDIQLARYIDRSIDRQTARYIGRFINRQKDVGIFIDRWIARKIGIWIDRQTIDILVDVQGGSWTRNTDKNTGQLSHSSQIPWFKPDILFIYIKRLLYIFILCFSNLQKLFIHIVR